VVVLAILVAFAVRAVPKTWYSQDAINRQNGVGKYAGLLTADQQAQVNREIPRLERFVAEQRGAVFPTGVTVRYLRDVDFFKQVGSAPLDAAQGVAPVARALGTASSTRSAHARARHLNHSDLVGLYVDGHVYMRGDEVDLETTDILVHELTHAWDDAQLPISTTRSRGASGADGANAVTALVEGDATRVQGDFLDSVGANLGCQVMDELDIPFDATCTGLGYTDDLTQIQPGDIDAAQEAYSQFPYTVGTLFVRRLAAEGGQRAVAAAFRHPPVDTAQVIEPALYLHHVRALRVAAPSLSRHVGSVGTLGELGVTVALTGGALDLGRHGYLKGWAGDRYVEDTEHGKRCLHDRLVLRSPAFARIALHRFRQWATAAPGRAVSGVGATSLTFTSCR
jgi:hypothetical protein